ncbi:hypothetical protein ARD30_19260 [Bosea thiooxidans]|uniref:Uncharacterized protein n=1 Tax=Bosea thiooxidans TaxID=53254 RepID=A0A0Q3SUV9_9HYPH|nr:hypothetical protein ARD30_19260 [Bosea thiooxidans]
MAGSPRWCEAYLSFSLAGWFDVSETDKGARNLAVVLALVASIHVLNTAPEQRRKTWMVGTGPTMTW